MAPPLSSDSSHLRSWVKRLDPVRLLIYSATLLVTKNSMEIAVKGDYILNTGSRSLIIMEQKDEAPSS